MFKDLIDVKENDLKMIASKILSILLYDNTTEKNIIWATDNYKKFGDNYHFNSQITIESITGRNGNKIKPRIEKSKKEKARRIKDNAEVFTPSWICNEQNNLADESWFENKNIFNKSSNKGWVTNYNKIEFSNGKTWEEYVSSLRMEISCGEAPYLTSRYDTVTGEYIDVKNRIGLLDRKLRIISENINTKDEWIKWSLIALKSIYGYDLQGDNVLLARENILFSVIDYYKDKFNENISLENIIEYCKVISWNIFQMDGIKFVIPNSCKNKKIIEYTLFGEEIHECVCLGCKNNNRNTHNGIYVKIMNWQTNRKMKFVNLINKK